MSTNDDKRSPSASASDETMTSAATEESTVKTEVAPAKAPEKPVLAMSKKAKTLYESLDKRGVDWRKLKKGINPLRVIGLEGPRDVGPSFMHLAVRLLLTKGTVSSKELREAFVEELEWGTATASSHVSIVHSLLSYTGAVKLDEGTMTRVSE